MQLAVSRWYLNEENDVSSFELTSELEWRVMQQPGQPPEKVLGQIYLDENGQRHWRPVPIGSGTIEMAEAAT